MFDLDARGLPVSLLVLALIVIPCGIGLFLGLFAWKGMAPLAFHCARCGADFTRKAWRAFPRRCAACGSRDWNR